MPLKLSEYVLKLSINVPFDTYFETVSSQKVGFSRRANQERGRQARHHLFEVMLELSPFLFFRYVET
jgi:hypothetical protein